MALTRGTFGESPAVRVYRRVLLCWGGLHRRSDSDGQRSAPHEGVVNPPHAFGMGLEVTQLMKKTVDLVLDPIDTVT